MVFLKTQTIEPLHTNLIWPTSIVLRSFDIINCDFGDAVTDLIKKQT